MRDETLKPGKMMPCPPGSFLRYWRVPERLLKMISVGIFGFWGLGGISPLISLLLFGVSCWGYFSLGTSPGMSHMMSLGIGDINNPLKGLDSLINI